MMDIILFLIDVGVIDIFKCNVNSLMLGVMVFINMSMIWIGFSEVIIFDGDIFIFIIDVVGWYFLEVINNNNGCISIDSV